MVNAMVSLSCCLFPGPPHVNAKSTTAEAKQLVADTSQPRPTPLTQQCCAAPARPAAPAPAEAARFSFVHFPLDPHQSTTSLHAPDPRPPLFNLQQQLAQLRGDLKEEQGSHPCASATSSSLLVTSSAAASTIWDSQSTRDYRVSDLFKRGSSNTSNLMDRTSYNLSTPCSPCGRLDISHLPQRPSSHPLSSARPLHSPPAAPPKRLGRASTGSGMGADRCRAAGRPIAMLPDAEADIARAGVATSHRSSCRKPSIQGFSNFGLDPCGPRPVGSTASVSGSASPTPGSELLRLHSTLMLQLQEVHGRCMSPKSERRLQMHKSRSLHSMDGSNGSAQPSLCRASLQPSSPGHQGGVHNAAAARKLQLLQQGRTPRPEPPAAAAAAKPLLPVCSEGTEQPIPMGPEGAPVGV